MLVEMKKFVLPMVEPLGIFWLGLIFVGLLLLWRRRWAGGLALLVFAVLMTIMGSEMVAGSLLASLERPYAGRSLASTPSADAVVMLGGAHVMSKNDAFGIALGDGADRAITALELMRLGKAKRLVMGGGPIQVNGRHLELAPQLGPWVQSWRLFQQPVLYLTNCATTYEEALGVKALAQKEGWKTILLVTSAYHLRRSEGVFRQAGVNVVPVACDFHVLGVLRGDRWWNPTPRCIAVYHLNLFCHEMIGLWVYRARGWLP